MCNGSPSFFGCDCRTLAIPFVTQTRLRNEYRPCADRTVYATTGNLLEDLNYEVKKAY